MTAGRMPSGRVASLHRKGEVEGQRGIPKPAVPRLEILAGGVAGDFNRYRSERKGGDPGMALLLLPSEVLADLRAKGWPVAPGDLGENVGLEGIPYGEMTPGTRWRLGSAVVEVSKACAPCTNLRVLPYVGGERVAQFVKVLLDRRGWYARVVVPGSVSIGDAVSREVPGLK